jgi:D-3-phosphoglycerate dehydrogenase
VHNLHDLVGESDIITIHIPSEKETYKIFNKNVLDSFKKGSYLINTSRGELVDEDALVDSLEGGHLAGAALDVFDGEYSLENRKILADSRLLQYAKTHNNLLLTPHIGGSTYDAWRLTEEYTIKLIFNELKI